MTPNELDRWAADKRRRREHETAMHRIREENAALRKQMATLRRAEEKLALSLGHSSYQIARYQAKCSGQGLALSAAKQHHQTVVEREGIILSHLRDDVLRWRAHIDQLLRDHQITANWDVLANVNGYAWASLRRIEVSPIVSPDGYVTALHEVAHIVRPCETSHTRVPTTEGTVCARCEINAWLWAQRHALDWRQEMHDQMAAALRSYRRHATPSEQIEIDNMTSNVGFFRALLERLTRSKE